MMKAKELPGGRRFRPDIIVHRRLSNSENLLVVETKARAQRGSSDRQKLAILIDERGRFRYSAGAFITFFNNRRRILRFETVRVSVDWITTEEETRIDIERPVPSPLAAKLRAML